MGHDGMIALNRSLLRVGERVCCAVSGGADSVAMLLAVVEWNARKESLGVGLSAVHVHHGLRGDAADGDELFVRELCARLGVPLTVFRVDTVARQAEAREGVEEAARMLRYERFWGLLAEGAADVVATAHTLDDQAETVVLKMLRGAWTEGLGGIAPVLAGDSGHRVQAATRSVGRQSEPALKSLPEAGRGQIIRPLLGVRRTEVEAFLRKRAQPWREDASNTDRRFTRNRVRHELMPVLRSYNPGIDDLLHRTAEIARDEEAFWTAEVGRLLPGLLLPGKPVRGGGRAVGTGADEKSFAMEVARLKALPAALTRRVLRAACRQELGAHLSSDETARLLALAGLASHPSVTARVGARLELRAGLRVERSARELQFVGRFGVSGTLAIEKEPI